LDKPLRVNLREGSTGVEFFSAVTLILLALATVLDPRTQSSIVVLLLSLSFPGVWLALVFAVGVLHLIALAHWAVVPWIVIRKVCSALGLAIYASLVVDLTQRGQLGGTIWLGTIMLLLIVAILRRRYSVA
jgi:hypothetical protein